MKALVGILAAAVIGVGAWYYVAHDTGVSAAATNALAVQDEPPLVTVQHVKKSTVADTIEALGTAQANESVKLTSKISDTIAKISFTDGEYVQAGDVLVKLSSAQAQANLAQAKAQLVEANAKFDRIKNMWAKKLTSKSELDTAKAQSAAAQAHYNALAAELEDRVIRAPFSGVLGLRQVSPGALVQPSTTITTLDDISTIKLDFTVPGVYIRALKPGLSIVAHSVSYPNRQFQGVVSAVGTRVDEATRAVPVRAKIPNPDHLLKPGMLLTVDLTTNRRQALLIPASAVYQIQDRAYVYRVDGDRTVHEQEIEAGSRHFGTVEVVAGLSEGDLIVTQGIIKLRDGLRVRYEDPSPEVTRMSSEGSEASSLSG